MDEVWAFTRHPVTLGRQMTNTRTTPAVTVTETDLSNLKFFAQYAAAGYCNSDAPAGSPVTCGNNGCPDVMANNATIVGALKYAK